VSDAAFFAPGGREQARAAIAEVEATTAAELVLQVRHSGGRYRDADYLWGLVGSLLVLLALLFLPRSFALVGFPVQVSLGFAAGAALSARLPWLRRHFVREKTRKSELHRSARAAFVDLGVARCSGRWGILVFVATFERSVEVVVDTGIDLATLGDGWTQAVANMRAAVAREDYPAFLDGLRALGPVLAAALPRRADDINELPDAFDDELDDGGAA
jgi:uncharacterized membrane protein